jgi:hypothetical protein
MHRFTKLAVAGAAVLALAAPAAASASVTLDADTGMGFVGKGDVQTPFGWNDAKLQSNAANVSFTYQSKTDEAYAVTCEWDTGNKVIVHHVQNKHANVADSVAYDVSKVDRKNPNGKVTGFNLLGQQNVTTSDEGTVPVVGDSCPATGNEDGTDNSVDKRITAVDLESSTTTESLTAHYESESHVLNWPVVEAAPVA